MLFLSGETDGVSSSSDVLFLSGDTHLWGFVFLKRGMVERREAAVSTSFPPCQFWHVAIRTLHFFGIEKARGLLKTKKVFDRYCIVDHNVILYPFHYRA